MVSKYLVFLPKVKGSIEEEWIECLEQIKNASSKGSKLIKLNVFIDLTDPTTYIKTINKIGNSIKNTYGDQCPAFNITIHPPEKPWQITVEAGYIDLNSAEITSKVCNSIPYIVRISESGKEVWAGGLGEGLFHEDTTRAAGAAFDQMKLILDSENMSFNHLVRQWNYIGNILEVKNELQNYQLFNEIRNNNYKKYRTVSGYPAATGVGMKFGGVKLDFYALKPEESTKIVAVDNPDQVKPYSYGQQVLKGNPVTGSEKKQPPQFERAVLLSNTLRSTIFISGTASIIGQDTIGVEDIEKQTAVTIENIKKLSDCKRISELEGNSDIDGWRLILLRVYIKNQKDFFKVKQICQARFPEVPTIYIEADICRDNLLVEIEAEFNK